MSDNHKQLTSELKRSLQEIGEASEMLDAVSQMVETDDQGTLPEQLVKIKAEMKKPIWHMATHNWVEGVEAGNPIGLEFEASFDLDVETLLEQINRSDVGQRLVTPEIVTVLKNQPQGEALVEVLTHALLPHAYGISRTITLHHSLSPQNDLSLIEEAVVMTGDGGLVSMDYAPLFSHFLPPPMALEKALFKKHFWVNVEFLRSSETFEKSFFWTDESNTEPLTVKIEAAWKRI